ncbi:MAG TPA: sialidase family protein [Nitrososphaeraceae archaeon]|nr:sialidase family protein [Nitrososphaeraceae archaeon]
MLFAVGFSSKAHSEEIVTLNNTKSTAGYNDKIFYISNNTGHSEEPQIIKNGSNIYMLWIDDSSGSRNIYFKKSSDNGCTFGPTMDLGVGKGGSLDPKMVVSGNYVNVIWEYTPENNGMIYWTRSSDNGASFEKVKNLGNNTGFNGFPQLASSGNNVFATWHDATDGIVFLRSTDNGASFEKVKNLGNNTGFNGFPQVAATANNVYVAWTDNAQEKYGQIFFTRSTDNGESFAKPFLVYKGQESHVNTTVLTPKLVAGAGDNNVYLLWQSGRVVQHARVSAFISDVLFTRSTDNGESFGDIVNLSNYSGWAVDPQIAVSEEGGVHVVWTNNATGNEEIILRNDAQVKNCISSNFTGKSINSDGIRNNQNLSEKSINVAIVEPTFTQAAYDKSFYMFYEIYDEEIIGKDTINFTNYTSLLSSRVPDNTGNWSGTYQIVNHLKWLVPKSSIDVLGDQDVHNRSSIISPNGENLYDVIMLQHQEYVSQQEYDNLKNFVSNGGILFLLTGNVFYGEVEYNEKNNTIKFVKGHNFAFNGQSAWRSVKERWMDETSEWTGGNYKCCFAWEFVFHNDPFGITHNEEHHVTNPKAKILLDYNATAAKSDEEFIIATYALEYKKGTVLTLGIWTVNKLFENERFLRFFDSLLFQYALTDA